MSDNRPKMEGLDAVPWQSLRDLHGNAKDTPHLLRELMHEMESHSARALEELHWTLTHDGDGVFEASLAALPFLFELVAWPALPHRAEVLELVCDIACHCSQYGYFEPLGVGGVLERFLYGNHREPAGLGHNLDLDGRIRSFVDSRQSQIVCLLDDADREVAARAIKLTSALSQIDADTAGALTRCLDRRGDAEIQASALSILDVMVAGEGIAAIVRESAKETNALLRFTATVGLLARRLPLQGETLQFALEALRGVIDEVLRQYCQLPCSRGVLFFYLSMSEQYHDASQQALEPLMEHAAKSGLHNRDVMDISRAIGILAIAANREGPAFLASRLSQVQRRAIELVSRPTFPATKIDADAPQLREVLAHFGIPTGKRDFERFMKS